MSVSASVAVGALLGFHWRRSCAVQTVEPQPFDAWIALESDQRVVLWVAKAEMGQGVLTSLPMVLAEELDVDWRQVDVRQAPVDPARYDHLTVGSKSVQSLWLPLRHAAAFARLGLIGAAAERWSVSRDSCHTESGTVVGPAAQRATYAELSSEAAAFIVRYKGEVRVKSTAKFRIIGRSRPRVDAPSKIYGSAIYGSDVRVDGMLRAVIQRCPSLGGRLRSVDAASARALQGVRAVFPIEPVGRDAFTRGGVVVVADDTWGALEGRRRLKVKWTESPSGLGTTAEILSEMRRRVSEPGSVVAERGSAPAGFEGGGRIVEAMYEVPFLAHATMEPMNATIQVRSDGVEAWLPTQNAADARAAIARVLQVAPESVRIHQTLLGGGFGRRDATDFVVEAAQVAAIIGKPVQVLWSREDDFQFDRYRPAAVHRLRAELDPRGRLHSWFDRMSSVSIAAFLEPIETAKPEGTEVGGAGEIPYEIPKFRLEYTPVPSAVPVGWWRGVADSINAFAVESFIDELASAARLDPLRFRLELLSPARRIPIRGGDVIETERLRGVLLAATRAAGWAQAIAAGKAQGLACHSCRGSYIATVAEVSLENERVVVHRLCAAVDCGIAVNPLGVEAQIAGGLQFALSAALYESITTDAGRTLQSNFSDYPVLRIPESASIEVQILSSDAAPSGVGEIGVPTVAPAVANALFRLTGLRLRTLPIQPQIARMSKPH